MAWATFFLLTFLSQIAPPSSSGALVHAGGQIYQLYCTNTGELIVASETGVCEKSDSGGVEHFEIRNEDGDAQFTEDAPAGKPFAYVAVFALANAGKEIVDVDTSFEEGAGGGPKSVHVNYYFEPRTSGLVLFSPPLMGIDGFAHVDSGVALSRTFDAGFVQFSVLLDFNLLAHRVEIMPDQVVFSAFPPHEREKPKPSPASGELKLYSTHDSVSVATTVKILPGHMVTWWQSLDTVEKPSTSQAVQILAAWAPTSLKPADNAPEGVQMVYYDWNNLWLQIEVDGHTGWIKGSSSLRTIGLTATNGQR